MKSIDFSSVVVYTVDVFVAVFAEASPHKQTKSFATGHTKRTLITIFSLVFSDETNKFKKHIFNINSIFCTCFNILDLKRKKEGGEILYNFYSYIDCTS